MDREEVRHAHRQFLGDLIRVAWLDETITEAEQRDIEQVAGLLGIGEDEYRLPKDIRIHQFIPKTAVQPVGVVVPPWAARLDVQCLHASSCQKSPDRHRYEFRPLSLRM